jgi:hypothetical protein
MMPEDQNTFLSVIQERNPIVVMNRDSDSAVIHSGAEADTSPNKTLCLWNRKLLPHLERKWVPDPGYYTVDGLKMPTLEFTPSFTATWEGKPGIGQGRLFGNFESYLGKPPDFEKWYESLVRWIRQNYQKSPAVSGGYVGPAAYELYKNGGYLLPNILPPKTKEWLIEIGKQHGQPRATLRSSKRAKRRS